MQRRVCFLIILFLFGAFWVTGFAQNPGTTGDPLVSKSYLDQFFRFRPLIIPPGEKLPLTSGALLILRSGRVKLRCAPGRGLVDLTLGQELRGGTFLPGSHLLLVADAASYTLDAQSLSSFMTMGLMPNHLKKK